MSQAYKRVTQSFSGHGSMNKAGKVRDLTEKQRRETTSLRRKRGPMATNRRRYANSLREKDARRRRRR